MNFEAVREIVLHSTLYNKILDEADRGGILLLVPGGSYAKGTNVTQRDESGKIIYQSDIDLRGIMHNPVRELLTMECTEKPFEHKDTDTVLYYLKHAKKLMLSNNPNILEMFGLPKNMIFYASESGQMLLDNIDIFLHKRAIESYGGYAIQQLRRAQNSLARNTMTNDERERHILGSLKSMAGHITRSYHNIKVYVHLSEEDREAYNKLRAAEKALKKILYSSVHLYIDKTNRKDQETEIYVDMNLRHYPLRDLKSIESDLTNVIRDYDSLNHRNNKKDEIHLNKHFCSLVHVLKMGTDINSGKGIRTYRTEDIKLLTDIRSGVYGVNEMFQIVDEEQTRFEYSAKNTVLPDYPNYNMIDDLFYEINKALVQEHMKRA